MGIPAPLRCTALNKRAADVHVERVAEFVVLRRAARFHARRQVARIVAPEAALSERGEKILQRFEAKEIERFVGDFEARFHIRSVSAAHLAARSFRRRMRHVRRLLLLLRDVAFLLHALNNLVDEILQLGILREVGIVQQLFHHLRRNQVAFFESTQNRFAQRIHVLLARFLHIEFVDAVRKNRIRSGGKNRKADS